MQDPALINTSCPTGRHSGDISQCRTSREKIMASDYVRGASNATYVAGVSLVANVNNVCPPDLHPQEKRVQQKSINVPDPLFQGALRRAESPKKLGRVNETNLVTGLPQTTLHNTCETEHAGLTSAPIIADKKNLQLIHRILGREPACPAIGPIKL